MDTSKEYIEMCEKAQEIQESKKEFIHGDIVSENNIIYNITWFDSKVADFQVAFIDNEGCAKQHWFNKSVSHSLIWLPRQDQLQAICTSNTNAHAILQAFYTFSLNQYHKNTKQAATFEQLWLLFTMREIYNKVWNIDKKEWILI